MTSKNKGGMAHGGVSSKSSRIEAPATPEQASRHKPTTPTP
jgi:hypothetical protein